MPVVTQILPASHIIPQLEDRRHYRGLLRPLKHGGRALNQLVQLLNNDPAIQGRSFVSRLTDRVYERPHLVQQRSGLIEQLPNQGRRLGPACQAKDVVHPLGDLSIVGLFDRVPVNLPGQLVDILALRLGGYVFGQFGKDRHRFSLQVYLLEIGVQEPIQRNDLPLRGLPSNIQHVAGIDHAPALFLGDQPVHLAPTGIIVGVCPFHRPRFPIGTQDLHLASFDLVRPPHHRGPTCSPLPLSYHILLPRAEPNIVQLIFRPLHKCQGLLAHQFSQNTDGLLAAVRYDIDSFKKVGIARIQLDDPLRGTPGEADGRLYVGLVGQLNDVCHVSIPLQSTAVKIQQGNLVSKHPCFFIDHDITLGSIGRCHRSQPLRDIGFIHLNTKRLCRTNDAIYLFLRIYLFLALFLTHESPPKKLSTGWCCRLSVF